MYTRQGVRPFQVSKANEDHERISENWQVNPLQCAAREDNDIGMSAFGWAPPASQVLVDVGS